MRKIVLVGYGSIARKHIEVFRALNCDIVASCNRSQAGNDSAHEEAKIKKTFLDYHEMIDSIKPDGILLTASYKNIYSVAKDLIPYRIPILLEKPSGTSLSEHNHLVSLAHEHDTPVQVALNRRHYSIVRKLMAQLNGAGNITAVLVEWSERPRHLLSKGMTLEELPLVIFGNTIHGIDMMRQFTGQIDDLVMVTKKSGEPLRWLMNFSGVSDKGVFFNFNSSWDSPVPWRICVYAENKRCVFAPLEQCKISLRIGEPEIILEPEWYDLKFKAGFYEQTQGFINLIDGGANVCSLESVTNSMQVAQKVFNSIN